MGNVGIFASARHTPGGGGGITATFQQSAVDAADAASYSFTSQPIGTASATRRVVVCVSARGFATSAVTIGGVTATLIVNAAGGAHTSQWSAVVPTGTTATIDVTMTGSASACGIGVWTLPSGDPTGQTGTATADVSNPTVSVTTSPGDVVIGSSSYRGASAAWAAATERYDEFMDTNIRVHTGADLTAVGASVDMSLTITSFNTNSSACAAAYA